MDRPQQGADRITEIVPVFYNSKLLVDAIKVRYSTFQELAEFTGQSADKLENDLLQMMKKASAEMLAYYEANPIEPIYQALLDAVKNSDNYWLRLTAQELYLKTNIIDTFLKHYPAIWLMDNVHLLEIAKSLPYPIPELNSNDDYYDFLFQIPFIYTFELDFNAQIMVKSGTVDIPVVHYNYPLFSVLDAFIETVAYVIFDSEDHYETNYLRSLERIREASQDPPVVAALAVQLKLLMGKVSMVARVGVGEEASYNLHHGFAVTITPFVYCHELGHMFLGHLGKTHTKHMEYEADDFATLYIKSLIEEGGDGKKFQIFLGLAAFFCLLYCRERLLQLDDQASYPTALQRYLHIVTLFDKSDHARMAKAWNNVVMATDYTLVKHFQIELPFADFEEKTS